MKRKRSLSNPVVKGFFIMVLLVFSRGGLYPGNWMNVTAYPGTGDMQSTSIFIYPSGYEALEGYWKGGVGKSRIIPVFLGGPIQWWNPGSWSPAIDPDKLPGSGAIQSQTEFVTPDKTLLYQAIWRGDQGWCRDVPVIGGTVRWELANDIEDWDGPVYLSSLPGSGSLQAQNEFFLPGSKRLFQRIWRNNQYYWRSVPRSGDAVDWNAASDWFGPYPSTTLPGSGDIQATTAFRLSGDQDIEERFWKNNAGYKRTLRMKKRSNLILSSGGLSYVDWIFATSNWIDSQTSIYHKSDDKYADDWTEKSNPLWGHRNNWCNCAWWEGTSIVPLHPLKPFFSLS